MSDTSGLYDYPFIVYQKGDIVKQLMKSRDVLPKNGVGWGMSCGVQWGEVGWVRWGRVVGVGWVGSHEGVGVGWDMKGWGGWGVSWRGVCHGGVGSVMEGWGGVCNGGVGWGV